MVPATANIQSRNAIPTGKVGEPRIWYPNSVKKVIEAKGLLAEKGSYCALREACSFGTRVLEPVCLWCWGLFPRGGYRSFHLELS